MKLDSRKTKKLHKLIWTRTKYLSKPRKKHFQNCQKDTKKSTKSNKANRKEKQSKETWNLGCKWNLNKFLVLAKPEHPRTSEKSLEPKTQTKNLLNKQSQAN